MEIHFSTVSSGLNSLATVTIKDFIQLYYNHKEKAHPSDKCLTYISKLLGTLKF